MIDENYIKRCEGLGKQCVRYWQHVGCCQKGPDLTGRHIVAAAVCRRGLVFMVPRPARHHDVIHRMVDAGVLQTQETVEGFLASDGRFVDREWAYLIAVSAGQIDWDKKTNPKHMLFSEDLW